MGNGGTLDVLNAQQITEARNGITVDPTSSIGQSTGRITAAPSAESCALLIVPSTTCSDFSVISTGTGSFVRAIEITIPGLGAADAQATTLRNLIDTTSGGVASAGSQILVQLHVRCGGRHLHRHVARSRAAVRRSFR